MGELKFALGEVMRERGITSAELAELSGVPLRSITEYRSARRKEPSLSTGLRLADAMEIDPHEFYREL